MSDSSKTVFISYRRKVSWPIAQIVYISLRSYGFDVFMDVDSLDAGNFNQIILDQVNARVHFVPILTPETLQRCAEPGDWVRREIETAIDAERNIVPVLTEEFSFEASKPYLTGKLAALPTFNGVRLIDDYLTEGIHKLRERFLTARSSALVTVVDEATRPIIEQKIARADEAVQQSEYAKVTRITASARSHLVHGHQLRIQGDVEGAVIEYTEAIRLDPNHAATYYARGDLFFMENALDEAANDYTQVIELAPADAGGYFFRAFALEKMEDVDGAISDYRAALQIDPTYPLAEANLRRVLQRRRKTTTLRPEDS